MTNLRHVAHCRHHKSSRAVHHHGRPQHHILRIRLPTSFFRLLTSFFLLPSSIILLPSYLFRRQHLARQAAFVHLQVRGFYQLSVGRHFVARLHNDDIAYHHLPSWYLYHFLLQPSCLSPPSHHLHRLFLANLVQQVKAPGGIPFKVETHRRGQDDGCDDAHRLHEVLLHEGQHQRHHCCHQQDANHRVLVFFYIQTPHRLPLRRCQHVLAVLLPTRQHFLRRQSLSHFFHFVCKVTNK